MIPVKGISHYEVEEDLGEGGGGGVGRGGGEEDGRKGGGGRG